MLAVDEAGKARISSLVSGFDKVNAVAEVEVTEGADNPAVDQLYAVVGARLQEHATDPTLTLTFAGSDTEAGFTEALSQFGKTYFQNIQKALRNLLCGEEDDTKATREQISNAFQLGRDAVAGAIAGAIASFLGIAPAIATILGVIVVTLSFAPALKTLCQVWTIQA